MTPHVHAELIKAWAGGAKIQWKRPALPEDVWQDVDDPRWMESTQYRIKPEPPKPYVRFTQMSYGQSNQLTAIQHVMDNVKTTFDPISGALLSIEKI